MNSPPSLDLYLRLAALPHPAIYLTLIVVKLLAALPLVAQESLSIEFVGFSPREERRGLEDCNVIARLVNRSHRQILVPAVGFGNSEDKTDFWPPKQVVLLDPSRVTAESDEYHHRVLREGFLYEYSSAHISSTLIVGPGESRTFPIRLRTIPPGFGFLIPFQYSGESTHSVSSRRGPLHFLVFSRSDVDETVLPEGCLRQ